MALPTYRTLAYRLVIVAQNDGWKPGLPLKGTELVYTSGVPGWQYIAEPPSGDGQSINPFDGANTVGTYSVKIIDAPVSGSNYVVTGQLADLQGRQVLNLKPAYIQFSTNAGVLWQTLTGGFVTKITQPMAGEYEVEVGNTQFIEQNFKPFASLPTASFINGQIISGTTNPMYWKRPPLIDINPCCIPDGFLDKSDIGAWQFQVVKQVAGYGIVLQATGTRVLNVYRHSANYPSSHTHFDPTLYWGTTITNTKNQWQAMPWLSADAGRFINCYAVCFPESNITSFYTLSFLSVRAGDVASLGQGNGWNHPETHFLTPGNLICLEWNTGQFGAMPAVGTFFDIYTIFTGPASTNYPVYIEDYPVKIASSMFDMLGIPYDASSTASCMSNMIIGPTTRIGMRITDGNVTLDSFLKELYAWAGFNTRINNSGSRQFIPTRLRTGSLPTETIGINDLRDDKGVLYYLDDQYLYNKITVQETRFWDWNAQTGLSRPIDGIVDSNDTNYIYGVDVAPSTISSPYGVRELVVKLPGMLEDCTSNDYSTPQKVSASLYTLDKFQKFSNGVGFEFLDRCQRGVIIGEAHLLTNITSSVGDFINVSMSYAPNAVVGQNPVSQLGGIRIAQIIKRTETPEGPDIIWWDAGSNAQLATAPILSASINQNDPRRLYVITVTNSGSTIVPNYNLRMVTSAGTLQPSGGLSWVIPALQLSQSFGVVYPPAESSGRLMWAKARNEDATGQAQASAWSSIVTSSLTSLIAPSNLSASTAAGQALITWTLGDLDIPIQVWMRPASQSGAATPISSASLQATMPEGSTQCNVMTVASSIYTVSVREAESPPFNSVSNFTEISFTASALTQITPPNTGTPVVGGWSIPITPYKWFDHSIRLPL